MPVGNFASLIQAINNGADAVYLGGKRFGARAFANNFTLEELENATKLCHLYGVKIYVTVNTLIYENEINEALEYVKKLHKMGIDAVIMQDVGFINLVHQTLPNLEIHASTQMHNHSEESLNFLKKIGIKRVVFARELTLDYINSINTDIEKEVFIHGALCISYSGQCLFSSHILGRSGNRGECAGMCRLPYKLYKNNEIIETEGDYLLSPKDLCSVDNFKALMESDIKCFKIEGRMKSPEYVGIVTKIYKNLMLQYEKGEELKVDKEDFELLKAIFNRDYTKGFLFNDNNIMNTIAPNHLGIMIGKVTNVFKKKIEIELYKDLPQFSGIRFKNSNLGMNINYIYDKKNKLINKGLKGTKIYLDNIVNLKEKDIVLLTNPSIKLETDIIKKIEIDIRFKGDINEKMELSISDNENNIVVYGDIVLEAINSPMTKDRISELLQKLGNTPFICHNINIDVDDNIFIPVGLLNELRREAILKLKTLREEKKKEYQIGSYKVKNTSYIKTNNISVLVKTKEQLKVCRELGIKNIIVNDTNLMEKDFIYRVPRDNIKHEYNYDKLLVTDYASLDKYSGNIADYFLNVTNHYSVDLISEYAKIVTLSTECDAEKIKEIMEKYEEKPNVEIFVYGHIELMIIKNCLIKSILEKGNSCTRCNNQDNYYIVDRNNKKYLIEKNPYNHSMVILSCNKTDLIKEIPKLKEYGITNFRIELLNENEKETKEIIERVKKYI